ncbi:NAD-dependent epimerase/dehydratase family protein [Pseudonocardia sp. NPDC049154]|uniref:NAD-dependent epimerase/dehydratase family protein n=1 Tax=Pseudonocardia sp. NPDC049154 TaxID=3155501 RepID=UPI0033DF7334
MTEHRVLVTGASGLIGREAVRAFLAAGWEVVGAARGAPQVPGEPRYRQLAVDLRDAAAAAAALADLPPITHLVHAAVFEKPGLVAGWSDPEQMAVNKAMLDNVLRPLLATDLLAQVTIMQGTKAYGVHLHPIPLPARERHPRDPHENFYWHQEDLLREYAASAGFRWTVLRPVQVVGPAYGVGYCMPPVIGAMAAICRRTGEPFGFPGYPVDLPKQVVDVRLVADALVWAAAAESADGEHFNLTNGEVFSWPQLWPALADALGVEPAEPVARSLAAFLPAHAEDWAAVADEQGLAVRDLGAVLGQSHLYADYTFHHGATTPPPPALVSTVKIKKAGFTTVWDTEESFRDAIGELQRRRILPDPAGRPT